MGVFLVGGSVVLQMIDGQLYINRTFITQADRLRRMRGDTENQDTSKTVRFSADDLTDGYANGPWYKYLWHN